MIKKRKLILMFVAGIVLAVTVVWFIWYIQPERRFNRQMNRSLDLLDSFIEETL